MREKVKYVRKLFLFSPPKRTVSLEEYELSLLEDISAKFDLGELLEYSRWSEWGVNYIIARFKGGNVKIKYIEGKEGIAFIKMKKKELSK